MAADGQAKACGSLSPVPFHTVEAFKDTFEILPRNEGTAIAHAEEKLIFLFHGADVHRTAFFGIARGIFKQIPENLAQIGFIGHDPAALGYGALHLHIAGREGIVADAQGILHRIADADGRQGDDCALALEAGEGEQIPDHALVAGTGNGEKVYGQVLALSNSLAAIPELRALIDNPMSVSDSRKFSLLESALGEEEMADELKRFIRLVMKNRRTRYLRLMLLSFISQYREEHNIKVSRLVTAVPAPELEERLASEVKRRHGDTVIFEHRVDPDIVGGFIFWIDGYMLDASTATQLKSVRRQFIEKNRRIV